MMCLLKKSTRYAACVWIGATAMVAVGSVALPAMVRAAELQMAPENPQFRQYLENKALGLLQTLSDDGQQLSHSHGKVLFELQQFSRCLGRAELRQCRR